MRGPGAEFAPQDSLRPRTSQIFFLVRELTIFCPLLFIFHPRALSSLLSLLSQILALSIYGQSTEEVTGSVERDRRAVDDKTIVHPENKIHEDRIISHQKRANANPVSCSRGTKCTFCT